jgi:ABC-type proline/glycine betaine transport system substrate-binding protein
MKAIGAGAAGLGAAALGVSGAASAVNMDMSNLYGGTGTLRGETINIAVPKWWPNAFFTSALLAEIYEMAGVPCVTDVITGAGTAFEQTANGTYDLMLAGWLPNLHMSIWNQYKSNLEKVQVNVEETWAGIVVLPEDAGFASDVDTLLSNISYFGGVIWGWGDSGLARNTFPLLLDNPGWTYVGWPGNPIYPSEAYPYLGVTDAFDAWNSAPHPPAVLFWAPHPLWATENLVKVPDPENYYGLGDSIWSIAHMSFRDRFPLQHLFLKTFTVSVDQQNNYLYEYSAQLGNATTSNQLNALRARIKTELLTGPMPDWWPKAFVWPPR